MELPLYDENGVQIGTVSAPDARFGLPWNEALVYQVVTSQAANRRQGTAVAKGRGEVRGGGRKPWRQKGSGRARHGSIRSPLWKGGGVTHGPLQEKSYKKKINKKMARKALYTVLSRKARDGEVAVLADVSFPEGKTKRAAMLFRALSQNDRLCSLVKGNGVLVVFPGRDLPSWRAIRNLPYADAREARNVTAHDLLQYKHVVFSRSALEAMNS